MLALKNFGFNTFAGPKIFGLRRIWSVKIISPKKLDPKSLIKIGPVVAEILLIWTNIARAYILPGQMFP